MRDAAPELSIPDSAAAKWFACGCSESGIRSGYKPEAIPLIVAAELRRLAEIHQAPRMDHELSAGEAAYLSACDEFAWALRFRADQLDPQ